MRTHRILQMHPQGVNTIVDQIFVVLFEPNSERINTGVALIYPAVGSVTQH